MIIGVAINVAVPIKSKPGSAMPSNTSEVVNTALAPVSFPCVAVMTWTLPASVSMRFNRAGGLRGSSSKSCQPRRA